MSVHVLQHPVATHCINQLRDKKTPPHQFRHLCNQVTTFLAVEATRDLPTRKVTLETPLEEMKADVLVPGIVIVAILRAGLGMIERFVQTLPDASVGYVGMERDEETAVARAYYAKTPRLEGSDVIVVDPMLATGGSAAQTLERVLEGNPARLKFACIVAAPEGVAELQKQFPEIDLHIGALDRQLDDRKFILPGLGDFGDRLYGTS